MDQWLPVVKRNREKEHIDFTQDVDKNDFRIQEKAANQPKKSVSDFEKKISQKL